MVEDDRDAANIIEGWRDRLLEVAEEARKEGFTVVCAISYYDPLSDQSGRTYTASGDFHACIGLASMTLNDMMGDF